jgi:cytochrome P450
VLSYAETMVKQTERLQERWANGKTINMLDEMMRLTLGIVSETLFNADVLGEAQELREALSDVFGHFADKMTSPLRLPEAWPTPRNRRTRKAIARVDRTLYRIIEEHRRSDEDPGDLLSLLLHARDEEGGGTMSDVQVRDEAMNLFIAGHETSACALAWAWYLLSRHQDVYAQVREEGDRVLGGRLPTIADLPYLPYTLQVFKEALRLYPPIYAFTRQLLRPIQLESYYLPKGATIIISPYTLHRRAELFPEPERFMPERFSRQREESLPSYSYIPFSVGPRVCVGRHFALLEGQLVLATLVQRVTFEFASQRDVELLPLVTLRPRGGVPLVVRRRG